MPRKSLVRHWSYSSWSLLKKCAAAFKYGQIDKLRGPSVPAMERGTRIHSLAENYLNGGITGGVPPDLRKLSTEFKNLKRAKPIVEKFWGLDPDWKPMEYGWVVAKTDAAVEPTKKDNSLVVVDHKTGRVYPDHDDQGSLYAAVGFGMYPKVEKVEVEFFYVDQGIVSPYEFSRKKLISLSEYWMEEGAKLMSTRKFLPTPSESACRWCGFRSDKRLANGDRGPCDAWKIVKSRW